jgi:VWFA-related protein
MMRPKQILVVLIVALVIGVLGPSIFAQSKQKKRPKLKDFGSSLERLRWDPIRQRAVESKPRPIATTADGDEDVIRIETNLVTSDILVVDPRGNLVENLTADDFLVTEDGETQQVVHFQKGDSATIPRSIVLIIDYSGSQFPFLRRSIDAAKLMVDKLRPIDVMAIVTDDVELLVDFTSDKEKLKKKLESLVERTQAGNGLLGLISNRRFGKSAQYSALMATLNEVFIKEDLRPIIVFQTDGDQIYHLQDPVIRLSRPPDLPDDVKAEYEQSSQRAMQRQLERSVEFSLADVYRAADNARATIYTVIPGFRLMDKTPEQQLELQRKHVQSTYAAAMARMNDRSREQFKVMQERYRVFSPTNLMFGAQQTTIMQTALAALAPRTGGWTEFLETPEQADGIYNRILADINHRYIVGYYPTNKAHDGSRRKLKFEIKSHPDYSVLGRTAYYAPSP